MITNENISQFSVELHIAGILIIERSTLIDLRQLIRINCNASIGLQCSTGSFFVCLKAPFSLTASNLKGFNNFFGSWRERIPPSGRLQRPCIQT